jgi:uncharacterized protein YcbK (DUF882 family)
MKRQIHYPIEFLRVHQIFGIFALVLIVAQAPVPAWASGDNSERLIHISNVKTGQKVSAVIITKFGTINVRSRQIISKMLGPDNAVRTVFLHPRLFLMLQRIADEYPGKTIEVLSGYRLGEEGEEDTHNLGRAVDFRISGIKTEELYEFTKSLPNCGTGFYPKADFVHLDVRDEAITWTDYFQTRQDCSLGEDPAAIKGGKEIEFLSVWNNESVTMPLVTGTGDVNNRGRETLSRLAANKVKADRIVLFHPRLILMLQKIADEFPGRRFEVISGWRPSEKGFHDYHAYGRAIDFRLSGMDNKKLVDFARTLPNCGVGYYPNSVFVHVDVRDKSTTWVDMSGVGEAPQYVKPGK